MRSLFFYRAFRFRFLAGGRAAISHTTKVSLSLSLFMEYGAPASCRQREGTTQAHYSIGGDIMREGSGSACHNRPIMTLVGVNYHAVMRVFDGWRMKIYRTRTVLVPVLLFAAGNR